MKKDFKLQLAIFIIKIITSFLRIQQPVLVIIHYL